MRYTVDAQAVKAVVERCTGRTSKLGGAECEVRTNAYNVAVLTLNAMDGQALMQSPRLLSAAAGTLLPRIPTA
jgi:hypothetical protein